MNQFMKLPAIVLFTGHCASGKTVCVTYCIKSMKAFDFVVVLSSTASFNGDYDFLKDLPNVKSRIYNANCCEQMFEKIMNIQGEAKKKGSMDRVLLVLDDVAGILKNSKMFLRLASTYRHFNISIFITIQFISNGISNIKELANYVCMWDQRTKLAKKAAYESYFNDVGTYAEFNELFTGLKPYQFFFIDRPGKKRMKFLVPYEKTPVLPKIGEKAEKGEKTEKTKIKDEKEAFLENFD